MQSKYYGGNRNRDRMKMQSYVNFVVPRVYASIACELWDKGWTAEEIEELFALSQARWEDSVENGWDMLKNVQEVTGIEFK